MKPPVYVTIVVEGASDEPVARRLIEHAGLRINTVHIKNGKGKLDRQLSSYNYAARHGHYFVLRDLNGDAGCAPEFVSAALPAREANLGFRIAVPEVEAWLLADAEGVGRFLGLPAQSIPPAPEALADPKRTFVEFARRARKLDIRLDMVPRPGSSAAVGPAYSDRIAELALNHWQPDRAARRSPSLFSCIRALGRWKSESGVGR